MHQGIAFIGLIFITLIHASLIRSSYDPNNDPCDIVCQDLTDNDKHPVCMMFSRYKRGYQFFVNLCHARRVICRDNLVLQMVHPMRCIKSGQSFMSID